MKNLSYILILQIYLMSMVFVSHAQDFPFLSNALSKLNLLPEYHSVFTLMNIKESNIAAITQLRQSQRYGSVLYDKFGVFSLMRFYGFVDFHMAIQNRRRVSVAATDSELFPAVILLDAKGRDINAHGINVIGANLTRIGMFFNPFNTASKKNLYAIFEFDFSGAATGTLYGAKIRHSFGEYVWDSGTLLFGQFFHPLFLPESFPRTVSESMGGSFDPQALAPQVRLTQMLGNVELILAIASEGYIESWGPANEEVDYIQNAITPNAHIQLKWRSGYSFVGAALDFKRLVPRLVSNTNYKVDERIDSIIAEAFIHNVFSWGELNLKVVYAENGSDQLLISGFGIRTSDPITNFQTYSNTAALSVWMDTFCVFYHNTMSLGLFVGGVKNLGSRNLLYIAPGTTQPTVYTVDQVAQNVGYNIEVTSRFVFARGSFRCGFELTWSTATFGFLNRRAQVINPKSVEFFASRFSLNYVF